MSGKIVMNFFPVRVWFQNETFGSETVSRLSWKKDTWRTGNSILFHWVGNELISFKPRSLTIQRSHSSFFRFIYVVAIREFEICSRYAIINDLHFHIFININIPFDDICNMISWLDVKAAVGICKSKHIFLDVMISKKHNSRIIFPESHYQFCINPT